MTNLKFILVALSVFGVFKNDVSAKVNRGFSTIPMSGVNLSFPVKLRNGEFQYKRQINNESEYVANVESTTRPMDYPNMIRHSAINAATNGFRNIFSPFKSIISMQHTQQSISDQEPLFNSDNLHYNPKAEGIKKDQSQVLRNIYSDSPNPSNIEPEDNMQTFTNGLRTNHYATYFPNQEKPYATYGEPMFNPQLYDKVNYGKDDYLQPDFQRDSIRNIFRWPTTKYGQDFRPKPMIINIHSECSTKSNQDPINKFIFKPHSQLEAIRFLHMPSPEQFARNRVVSSCYCI